MLKLGLERRLEENSKVCQMFLSVSQVSSIRERSHYLKASWVISAPFCLTSTLSRLLWCLGTQVYNWSSGPEFVLSMILMTFEWPHTAFDTPFSFLLHVPPIYFLAPIFAMSLNLLELSLLPACDHIIIPILKRYFWLYLMCVCSYMWGWACTHCDAVWRSEDNHRRVGLCLPFVHSQSLMVHSCIFQARGMGYSLTSAI